MAVFHELLDNAVAATFLIVALGCAVGGLRVAGVSFGTAAVLFVAMAFGHWRLVDPADFHEIGELGVVLFVYAIGLRAGPRIVHVFRGQGRVVVQIALATVAIAAASTAGLGIWLDLDPALVVGVFAGAMTSTPALAAATEASGSHLVSVAYGVAYPVGVVAVVLFAQVLPRWFAGSDGPKEDRPDPAAPEPVIKRTFRVENPGCVGKTINDLHLHRMVAANVSRIVRGENSLPATAATTLERGDIVVVVGTQQQLDRFAVLIGPEVDVDVPTQTDVVARDIFVTERRIAGKSLRQLQLPDRYGIVLSRVRREMIEFVPGADFVLEVGDQIRAVGAASAVESFVRTAGFHERRLHETGIPAFAVGLVLGVLVGIVELPLPWGGFRLGLAGGPLLVGLVFGHFGRIGGLHIRVPPAARYLMRELGLLFFLVSSGTSAGVRLLPVLQEHGPQLILVAAVAAISALAVGLVLGYIVFRQSLAATIGMTCGAMTSTPGLGVATAQFDSDAPALAYAAVYPIALVAMTLAAQFLLACLG